MGAIGDALPYHHAVPLVRDGVVSGALRMVARANTPWTLLGIEAWLDRNWRGGEGVVLLMPNAIGEVRSWPAEQTAFIARYPGLRAIRVAPFTVASHRLQNARRARNLLAAIPRLLRSPRRASLPTLHVVAPRQRDVTLLADLELGHVLAHRSLRFHLIDEGFGDLPLSLNTAAKVESYSRSGPNDRRHRRILKLEIALRDALERIVVRHATSESHFLLSWHEASRRCVADERLLEAYRVVLSRYASNPPFALNGAHPRAIVLTNCLAEFNTASLEDERAMCDRVCRVLDALGYDIVLKPHPREAAGKYDTVPGVLAARNLMKVANSDAAEKLFPHLRKQDILVGLVSNSMLTGHLLYGLTAYSLDDLARSHRVAPWLLETVACYHPAFVQGLHSFGELEARARAADGASVGPSLVG